MIYLFILFRIIYYYVLHVMMRLEMPYIGHNNTLRSALETYLRTACVCKLFFLDFKLAPNALYPDGENNANIL